MHLFYLIYSGIFSSIIIKGNLFRTFSHLKPFYTLYILSQLQLIVWCNQISGAKVILHEPRLGTSDRIVVISGTPDETQAAQSLLQAFILTGQ